MENKNPKTRNPIKTNMTFSDLLTYHIAKTLNQILKARHIILHKIHRNPKNGLIKSVQASLDTKTLFTNIPVNETDILIKNAYTYTHHSPSPKINLTIFEKLILACSIQVLFDQTVSLFFFFSLYIYVCLWKKLVYSCEY